MSNSKIFIPNFVCVLTNKNRKHIEQNFHSVAGAMPQGWDLRVLGGSKTLAWGFAMASHRLRILVAIVVFVDMTLLPTSWFIIQDNHCICNATQYAYSSVRKQLMSELNAYPASAYS